MIEKLKKYKNFLFSIFLLAVFLISSAIWHAPIFLKGYPLELVGSPQADSIIMARNYVQSGVWGLENELSVILAPEDSAIAEISSLGNKFEVYSWALIFKLFGWQGWDNLVFISILLFALGAVFFTLTVRHLFGLRIAVIFPFVYALLPFSVQVAQQIGAYEFSLFYFSLFSFLFFWGRDQRRFSKFYLILAGIFLAISCLSREAMFIFLPIFFGWLIYKKNKQEFLTTFVPVVLLLAIFWLPSFSGFNGGNGYLRLFVAGDNSSGRWSDFPDFHDVNPDPYTFYFDQTSAAEQLEKEISGEGSSIFYKIDRLKVGKNAGLRPLGVFEYFVVGINNLVAHISKFFAIEFIGGPSVFLLMLVGFWRLKRHNKDLYYFFIAWLAGTILLISFVVLAIRNHLMDFGWVIATLAALGIAEVYLLLKNYFQISRFLKLATIFIILVIFYNLILANHVYLGRGYDDNGNLAIKYLAQKTIEYPGIAADQVIAVGDMRLFPFFNYLTGKSIVYFDSTTVNKLAPKGELQAAFDKFGVKYFIGFDQKATDLIASNSQAKNIAVWPDSQDVKIPVSYNQMWFLNIIK